MSTAATASLGDGPVLRPVPGGWFTMGSDRHYPEEAPAHRAWTPDLEVADTPVTNRDFARFVAATGHVTVAERAPDPDDYPGVPREALKPGSVVFTGTDGPTDLNRPQEWWRWVHGAQWRHPEGPGSDIEERMDHPVVQVAYEDASAYARWAGLDLPTETEWEHAARGGLDGAEFAWGDDLHPQGEVVANTWIGAFPWRRIGPAGVDRTCPVRSFPPNGYGLYEACGNVWEWTSSWYSPSHTRSAGSLPVAAEHRDGAAGACCGGGDAVLDEQERRKVASLDPSQPHVRIPRRVIKGGSFLCSPDYCRRYRPAARQPQMVDTGTSHLGFRCIRRSEPTMPEATPPSLRPR